MLRHAVRSGNRQRPETPFCHRTTNGWPGSAVRSRWHLYAALAVQAFRPAQAPALKPSISRYPLTRRLRCQRQWPCEAALP